jgi:hypothetical protein
VNPRQEYALLHPLGRADVAADTLAAYRLIRKARGLLLMSILAVDR